MYKPGHADRPLDAFPYTDTAMCRLPTTRLFCCARYMALSDQQMLDSLSRMPFIDTAALAGILGETLFNISDPALRTGSIHPCSQNRLWRIL